MWNQNDDYYNELKNILPRGGVSSKYFEGISPRFIRRFIGSYAFTNKMEPILAEYAYDSERFAVQDNKCNHADFEFYITKNDFGNGMRFRDENSHLMFGRMTVKKDNMYKNEYFIEGRIFTEIGLFQIYNGTICFYRTEDLIRYAEEKDESLNDIQHRGLPMQNNVQHVEISGDFEWLFNIVCSIREGNLDVLNKFSEFGNMKTGMLQQGRSLK